jgi:hypothetical protein
LTAGEPIGDFWATRRIFFLAHERDLAESYADEGLDVLEVRDLSTNPLILDTAEKFQDAWLDSGAGDLPGPFHPTRTNAFGDWARAKGYDSIVVTRSAFDGELGFEVCAGTIGEPQTFVLRPDAIEIVGRHPTTGFRHRA